MSDRTPGEYEGRCTYCGFCFITNERKCCLAATHVAQLERELQSARQQIACLTEALRVLYDDNMDYIKINNLCGAENNHALKLARAALSGSATKESV